MYTSINNVVQNTKFGDDSITYYVASKAYWIERLVLQACVELHCDANRMAFKTVRT